MPLFRMLRLISSASGLAKKSTRCSSRKMKRGIRWNAKICLLSSRLKHFGNAGWSMKGSPCPKAFATRAIQTHNGWTRTASRSSSRRLNSCLRKGSWKDSVKADQFTHVYLSTCAPVYLRFMKLLITGASGLLGINLAMESLREHEVVGVDRGKLKSAPFDVVRADLTYPDTIESVINSIRPEWLINCAALANLEACEEDPLQAKILNTNLPGELAAA